VGELEGVTVVVGVIVGVTLFVGVMVGVGFGNPAPTLEPAPLARIRLKDEKANALLVMFLFNDLKSGGIAILIFIFQYIFFLSFFI